MTLPFPTRGGGRVLAKGNQRVVPTGTTYSQYQTQVFQWNSEDGKCHECTLEFWAALNGIPVGAFAGNPSSTLRGEIRLTYGAGNVANFAVLDFQNGSYQLPPCDYCKADIFFQTLTSTDPLDVNASLAEGLFPGARPPTWTRFEALTVAGSPVTFAAPQKAHALDVQVQPFPAAVPVVPLPTNLITVQRLQGGATRGQVMYFSMDGAANYPAYSPVVLFNDQRHDISNEWEVRAFNADSFYRATFFLAL